MTMTPGPNVPAQAGPAGSPTPASPAPIVVDVSGNIISGTNVTMNLGQDVHITTRDKVELILRKELPRYRPTGELLAVWALVLSLLTTLVSANFNNALGISSEQWQLIFVMACAFSGLWAIYLSVRIARRISVAEFTDKLTR